MARNKNLGSKLRRAKKMKQSQTIPSWVVVKTNRRVRESPYSRRSWRNTRLKRDQILLICKVKEYDRKRNQFR